MVTEVQDVPCVVVEVANYDDTNLRMGKFVRVQFDGEAATRRYTLHRDLNGAAPAVGEKVKLTLESYLKAQGARDGSGRVFYNIKQRVIAAKAA